MFYRWRTNLQRARFYRMTRGILETPPMPVVDAPWSIISMVGNTDVQMYLLSLKSFYTHVRRGKIVAIVARNMPDTSRDVLRSHFPGIRIVILEDIDTGRCQRGGTWERLVYILDHTRDEYAVQIDCDTLSLGRDIAEVVACLEGNVPFTLGSGGNEIVRMPDAAASARKSDSAHISIVAERFFDQYPNADKLRYVRGSSGFAGFSKSGFARSMIEDFHDNMQRILGRKWSEWGTEQCASNFAIANSPNAVVMHRPKYANFSPGIAREKASFLHFYGTHRYMDDYFAERSRDFIAKLGNRS